VRNLPAAAGVQAGLVIVLEEPDRPQRWGGVIIAGGPDSPTARTDPDLFTQAAALLRAQGGRLLAQARRVERIAHDAQTDPLPAWPTGAVLVCPHGGATAAATAIARLDSTMDSTTDPTADNRYQVTRCRSAVYVARGRGLVWLRCRRAVASRVGPGEHLRRASWRWLPCDGSARPGSCP
jgi:hypothetical protein